MQKNANLTKKHKKSVKISINYAKNAIKSYHLNKAFTAKKFLILIIFAIILIVCTKSAVFKTFADNEKNDEKSVEQALSEQVSNDISKIDFNELDDIVVELEDSANFDIFDNFSFRSAVEKVVSGDLIADAGGIFESVKTGFLTGIKKMFSPLVGVIVVALLYSLYLNLVGQKTGQSVSAVIKLICMASISIIIIALASGIIKDCTECIGRLQKQMNIVFPILLSLMTAVGGVASVNAYSPTTLFLSNIVSNIFSVVLFPIFTLVLIISIANNFSNRKNLNGLNSFLKSSFKWVIGSVFAIFIAVLSIQGATAGVSDGINIKATKYALKNYIPYLGGYVSDGFALVKASGIILKNSVGYVALLLLISSVIVPIIKVAVFCLALKLCGALVEPLGDSKTVNIVEGVSGSFKMLVAIIVAVALMYFLMLMFIVCSLNVV